MMHTSEKQARESIKDLPEPPFRQRSLQHLLYELLGRAHTTHNHKDVWGVFYFPPSFLGIGDQLFHVDFQQVVIN